MDNLKINRRRKTFKGFKYYYDFRSDECSIKVDRDGLGYWRISRYSGTIYREECILFESILRGLNSNG